MTLLRSVSRTLGSPFCATVCRAMFLARSQFTGPPCQDIRSANWRSASANCCGSPSGPSGPAPPNGPSGPPPPSRRNRREPPGHARVVAGASARAEAEGRISHLPRPLRQDGRVHTRQAIPGAIHGEHRVAQVRPERSPEPDPGSGGALRAASPGITPMAATRSPAAATRRPATGGPPTRGRSSLTGAAAASAWRSRPAGQSPLSGGSSRSTSSRGDVSGVTWRIVDVRDPALAGRLADVDVIVHTDVDLSPDSDARARRAFNVRGAQTVLTAAAAGGVGRVILVTSAMVYGASRTTRCRCPRTRR